MGVATGGRISPFASNHRFQQWGERARGMYVPDPSTDRSVQKVHGAECRRIFFVLNILCTRGITLIRAAAIFHCAFHLKHFDSLKFCTRGKPVFMSYSRCALVRHEYRICRACRILARQNVYGEMHSEI